ncbi:MAG: hypothetical protein RLO50_10540 [Azospirillaceae bacterium]
MADDRSLLERLKDKAGRAWHWLNLVLAAVGAAIFARLSVTCFNTAAEQGADMEWTWYTLGGLLILGALWLVWEAFRRLSLLGLAGRKP